MRSYNEATALCREIIYSLGKDPNDYDEVIYKFASSWDSTTDFETFRCYFKKELHKLNLNSKIITHKTGQRFLAKICAREHIAHTSMREYKVLEISPSRKWIKLFLMDYGDYNGFWVEVDEINVIEVLECA